MDRQKMAEGGVEGFGKVFDPSVEKFFTKEDETAEKANAHLSGKEEEK